MPFWSKPSRGSRVLRVKVVSTFLKAAVPLNMFQNFQEILEEHAFKLADPHRMHDLIPFIFDEEWKRIKSEIEKKNVSVLFDGTTRLGEALAIIVRFVDNWHIVQRLIRVQMLVKTMHDWGGNCTRISECSLCGVRNRCQSPFSSDA